MGALSEKGIYGPKGWTIHRGVHEILGATQEFIFGDPSFSRFRSAQAQQVSDLLDVLPPENLDDYQNMAPSFGDLARACITHPHSVTVSGYIIAPPRPDERVTIDGITLHANPVEDELRVRFEKDAQAEWLNVWTAVAGYLGLEASKEHAPDELKAYPDPDRQGQYCWWIWWD